MNMYVSTCELSFSPNTLSDGTCFARQIIPEDSLYSRITLVLAMMYKNLIIVLFIAVYIDIIIQFLQRLLPLNRLVKISNWYSIYYEYCLYAIHQLWTLVFAPVYCIAFFVVYSLLCLSTLQY